MKLGATSHGGLGDQWPPMALVTRWHPGLSTRLCRRRVAGARGQGGLARGDTSPCGAACRGGDRLHPVTGRVPAWVVASSRQLHPDRGEAFLQWDFVLN